MNRSRIICRIAVTGALAALLLGAVAAQTSDEPIRALWVDGQGRGLRSLSAVETLVETAQTTGFNTIIVVARSQGEVLHRSALEPRPESLSDRLPNPLGALIDQCRSAEPPLRIFAAANVLSVHRGATLPRRDHVAARHPEWIMEDHIGGRDAREHGVIHTFLDPGLEDVRIHCVDVIRELLQANEFDAFVLDDMRYPTNGRRWGYSALALEAYHRTVGDVGIPEPDDSTFGEWRRDQMTTLLRAITQSVRAARPELPIYVCVETTGPIADGFERSGAHRDNFQDWPRWINAGLCDGLVVKIVRDGRSATEQAEFQEWLQFARGFTDRVDVIIAASGLANYRSGLFRQLRETEINGLGMALRDYDHPARDHGEQFFDDLNNAVFRQFVLDTAGLDRAEQPEPLEILSAQSSAEIPASPEVSEPLFAPLPTQTQTPDPDDLDIVDLSDLLPPPTDPALLNLPPADDIAQTPPPDDRPISGRIESLPALTGFRTPPPRTGVFEDLPRASVPAPALRTSPRSSVGDAIDLLGGRRVTGAIIEEVERHIVIQLDSGNIIRIPRDRIESIQRSGLPRPGQGDTQ